MKPTPQAIVDRRVREFTELAGSEVYEIAHLRQTIFIVEQA